MSRQPTGGTADIPSARPTKHVMINTAASQLRRHPGRIGAVLLAVMISVGYLTATLSFMATETHAIGTQISARTAGADVVVSSDSLTAEQLSKRRPTARKTDGVSSVAMSYQIYATIGRTSPLTLQNLPAQQQLRWAQLSAGHWPTNADQIALGRTSAAAGNVTVGDQVTVDLGGQVHKLTVTGITDETKSLFSGGTQTGFVADSFITHPEQYQADLLVIGNGSVSQQQLADRLDQRLDKHVTVHTRDAYGAEQVKRLAQGADVLRNLLLVFGAIALLVGSILIVNTFLILLAQRRRQVGLLRAVGASGSQVRRSLLVEAVITGVVGAVLGVALGIGGSALATAISGSLSDGLIIPPTVAIAAVVGILVTLLAAIGPARRATRVSPLEALRPVDDTVTVRRGSTISGIVAAVLAVAGAGLIIIGLKMSVATLLSCIAGSMLIAIAVLLGAKLYFPWLLRAIGLIVRGFGPIGRLATENTARNPGRAAATGAALMLATGLIVTLQVGSASVKASTNLTLDQHYPVDVTAAAAKKLPADTAERIGNIPGIERVVTLKSVPATIITGDHRKISAPLESAGNLSDVINKGAGTVPKDRVLIDPYLAGTFDLRDGSTVQIRANGTTRTMRVEANRIAADGVAVVDPSVLRSIAPKAAVTTVWAKAAPNADAVKVTAALSQIVEDHPDLQISGSLTTKASYTKLLDTLLTIATVLLAVAVVIALIGVGNTLGLSVIERSRESALLRALGLQRRQLRLMLAIEAVLLALAGALVGIAAGAFFGWIGTAALGSELEYETTVFSISGTQTAVVAGIAIVAGVLASVLPARRAARATPVSALAES